MKPLVLLTSGTRGDVQPVIALALGLQEAGLPVRLAAPSSFRAWIESFNLSFAQVDGNPSDLLTRPGAQSALTYDGNPIRSLRASAAYVAQARPIYAQMFASAWLACRDARALIIGLPTTWGIHIAEALEVPCLGAFLQPVTPTRAFPAPIIPLTFSLGGTYNRLTYAAAGLVIWLPWREILNRFRSRTLGLPPLNWPPQPLPFGRLEAVLYGFSPRLAPAPADWPASIHATGFWRLPQRPFEPSAKLQNFLDSGPLPVYMGFGSPGVHDPQQTLDLSLEAVEMAGIRAVIALPGASFHDLSKNAHLLLEGVPHDWLFPRVAGVVHHGGAGTIAAGLLAGQPSLLVPLGADQFFWGKRIRDLGLGPAPIPRRKLTARRLGAALLELTDDCEARKRAQAFGQILREEDGVAQAVAVLRQFV
jgi:sterol 3beta-glucosyltransferase